MKENMPRTNTKSDTSLRGRAASLAWLWLAGSCAALAQAQEGADPGGAHADAARVIVASADAVAGSSAADLGAAAAPGGAGDITLENIVVSARKREEKLQDVPLAISSIPGGALERDGDYNIQDLSDKVPGIYIAPSNPRQTSIQIRGIGKNSANDGLETSVGVYVDGVYLAQPGEATFDLNDLDHVEVLRGPQGTLFGKNNTAGAVAFYTRKPSLTPGSEVEVIGGKDSTYEFHASATGPLADKTAFRLSAYDKSRDGFFHNLYDGNSYGGYDRKGVRGQLLDESVGDLSLRVIAEHYDSRELFANTSLIAPFTHYANGQAYTKSLPTKAAGLGYAPVIFDVWSRFVDLNSARPIQTTQNALSAQATLKLGGYTLDSITAFRRYTFDAKNDGDATPLDIVDWSGTVSSNRHWSEELRLSSPAGERLQYVAGLYYYHLSLWSNSPTQFGTLASSYYGGAGTAPGTLDGVLQNTIGTPETNSTAAFFQADYHLTDGWTATGGLRETRESKSASIVNTIVGGADPATLSAADLATRNGQIVTGSTSTAFTNSALSWLGSLSYRVNEDLNSFVTVSRGFKSGGINIEVTDVPLVVAPETATDVEAGIKSQWWDRRLQFNGNLYWSRIRNYQGNFQSANPILGQYIANVGDVRVRGLELEAAVRPLDGLHLSLSAAYNNAVYLDFTNATCPTELSNLGKICDFSGRTLPFAPRFTGTLAGEYTHRISASTVGYAGGSLTAHSSENVNSGLSAYGEQTAYTLTDLQAGVIGRNGAYDLSFWVKNLFDAQYLTAAGVSSVLGVKVITGTPGDPRTYGATLRLYF
jgi:iron complex outermembrane receptor protein